MLYYLVVLYKYTCAESPACRALQHLPENASVIVYDNSESPDENRCFCTAMGWTHLGGDGNVGLSKAYNTAVNYLEANTAWNSIALLDEDTAPTKEYLTEVYGLAESEVKDIVYCPILLQNGKIVSPWKDKAFPAKPFFKRAQDCLHFNPGRLLAFNSGMLIPRAVLKQCSWDERLFLDGVDISFIRRIRENGMQLSVMNICLEHDFSGRDYSDSKGAMSRFGIYLQDLKTLCGHRKAEFYFTSLKRALHLSLCGASLKPLSMLLSSWKGKAQEGQL